MKRVFEHREASCKICSEPTDERYRIGEYFYCADHYEKEREKPETEKMHIELSKHKKFVSHL